MSAVFISESLVWRSIHVSGGGEDEDHNLYTVLVVYHVWLTPKRSAEVN